MKYNTMFDDKGSPTLEDYNALLGYSEGDYVVSLKSAKKLSAFSLGVHYDHDLKTKVAVQVDLAPKSGAKTITAGGSYVVDSETTVQGKVDSNAIVSANLIQKVSKQVKVVASAQVDSRNFAADSHKFGLQLVLG